MPSNPLPSDHAPLASERREKLRLGDVLVQQKLISADQLEALLQQQRGSGRRLGRMMIDAGVPAERIIAQWKGEVDQFMKVRGKCLMYD